MGRHEIRLRRQKMTSRRIEGYKDYASLLEKHKADRTKRIIKMILLLAFFIGLLLFVYYFLPTISNQKPVDQANTISRPGVSIFYSPNTNENGKT